jgi:polar amino acid transport system substrate-binding protein
MLEKFMRGVQLAGRVRPLIVGAFAIMTIFASRHASAETSAAPSACQALQAKYRQFKGKTLISATSPHTPGYEALDPQDPGKYIGFDIDLGEMIGKCLGFNVSYKPVTFAALLTTLQSGQADMVMSDLYATEERTKAADFITYSKVFDGVLVAKGNPKKITGINTSMCDTAAAESTGYLEVPLIQNTAPACKAEGKAEASMQLYDNNASCIQAILTGRADVYVNDVNTVDQAAKAYPDKLEKVADVALPYSVAVAVPKNKPEFRDALMAALVEIQKAGIETELLRKWSLDAGMLEAPRLVTAK